jgi:tetraacyldisaccharide 4'-kinase
VAASGDWMSEPAEIRFRRVMDGTDRSAMAAMLRGAAACAEPVYATAMRARNAMIRGHRLGRPTISVGNIATGGTGKTPIVRWLASALLGAGRKPAVLMRGYKSVDGISDEQTVLARGLGDSVPLIANPDRRAGAAAAIAQAPLTDLFILDDGMQHRRVARDFELVLINAGEPFGLGRVFPRGFLREPLSGLGRADALVVTHADEVDADRLEQIERTLRQFNPFAPIFRADHVITGLEALAGKPFYAFCGIGSPESFFSQVAALGNCVGRRAFADHHHYTAADLDDLNKAARSAGAAILVTTEKDWAKLSRLPPTAEGLPVIAAGLCLRFHRDHEARLLEEIKRVIDER